MFARKNRRKLIAAAAIGAAAAGAAYYWWTYETDEQAAARKRREDALKHLQSLLHGERRRGDARTAAGAGASGPNQNSQQQQQQQQQDQQQQASTLDESLQAHFDSIQALSERQALEDLLPRLRDALHAATDYEPLREALRAPGLAPADKRALWAQLASHAFTRAVGGAWLVPLLDLLVRLKLHIVARHMYLEVTLPALAPRGGGSMGGGLFGGGGGGGAFGGFGGMGGGAGGGAGGLNRGALPPKLSDRAKEEFFRSDFFVDVGAAGLLHRLRGAVDAVLAAVDFGGSVTPADVERVVVAIHARFEAEFARSGEVWAAYLVPPGGQPVAVPAAAGGVEALMSPSEALAVDALNAELREAASGYRFLDALRAGVRHTSRALGGYVQSKMAGGGGGEHGHHHHHHHKEHRHAAGNEQQQQHGEHGERKEQEEQQQGGGGGGGSAAPAEQQQQHHHHHHAQQQQQQPLAPKPFPLVVPIVAKSSALLFDEATRCTRGLSALREVQALCASVFTFGPHVSDVGL